MTLQQEVFEKISILPDNSVRLVLALVDEILNQSDDLKDKPDTSSKKIKRRTAGGLKGPLIITDDFDEPLDCFKEYM